MSDSKLVYTSMEEIIKAGREKGHSDEWMIRRLASGKTATDVRAMAEEYARLFGITPAKFFRTARYR